MNKFIVLFTVLALLGLAAPSAEAKDKQISIQLMIDDSGLLTSPEEANALKMNLLSQLKALLKRREFANARLDVITTSLGRTRWIGDLRDLKDRERASALVELMPAKADYCNSLVPSFTALGNNIRQRTAEGYSDIHVLIFSSLIDTGGPCDDEVVITLPQLPPDLDVSAEVTPRESVKRVSFFWVNPHQLRIWSEKLRPLESWASSADRSFELLGEEETRFMISKGRIIGGRR